MKLPNITSITDLRSSIKTTLNTIDTVQERVHNECIACVIEFFRPESKGNTNWIKEHIIAYSPVGGSLRVQAIIGWYEDMAGVVVVQNKEGIVESVRKNKKAKITRDVVQLNKCKAFPFYKWGLLNLEPPLKTPTFPAATATMLAKMLETGVSTQEEIDAWIGELSAKVTAKRKDETVIKFVTKFNKQHEADKEDENTADADKAFMESLKENDDGVPPVQEVAPAQAAQA